MSEVDKNIRDTLSKLPKEHRKLVDGYKFNFQDGNTLKNDDKHVGYINNHTIAIAAPWHYGREFTFLHEVAHKVWEELSEEQKKMWKKIEPKDSEEKFCMAYAQHYSDNPILKYNKNKWKDFIKKV